MSNVIQHYNYLHSVPEPGFAEFKTAAYASAKLQQAGFNVRSGLAGSTGLVAEYNSGMAGPVLCIRADMDCLTHVLNGQKVYRHTCGHDAHTAMLIAAGEKIISQQIVKRGMLKLLFQPAEELGQGAKKILETNELDNVEYLLGMHIRPTQECVAGSIIASMQYSATYIFTVVIKGYPSHGARPHLGVNAIDAATAAIIAVNAVHVDPRIPHSIKCTRFKADGGAFNAVPEDAEITFDLRAQNNATLEELLQKAKKAIEGGVASVGAQVTEYVEEFYCPAACGLVPEMQEIIIAAAREIVGGDNIIPTLTTPGGEDFFHYTLKNPHIKAGFIGLGVGAEPGLHHPEMHFDSRYLENGVAMLMGIVKRLLG